MRVFVFFLVYLIGLAFSTDSLRFYKGEKLIRVCGAFIDSCNIMEHCPEKCKAEYESLKKKCTEEAIDKLGDCKVALSPYKYEKQ